MVEDGRAALLGDGQSATKEVSVTHSTRTLCMLFTPYAFELIAFFQIDFRQHETRIKRSRKGIANERRMRAFVCQRRQGAPNQHDKVNEKESQTNTMRGFSRRRTLDRRNDTAGTKGLGVFTY